MKAWTKKFINQPLKGSISTKNCLRNAQKAQKKIKIPAKLWNEISVEFALAQRLEWHIETAFAMGLAVGWAEHEKSVK